MRLSIQAKTLALFIAIPLVSLGSFLFASSRLFENDKKAYVYSTSYSEARSIGDQISSWIESQVLVLKSLIFLYDPATGRLNSSGQQFFRDSAQIRSFAIYEKKDGGWVLQDSLQKEGVAARDLTVLLGGEGRDKAVQGRVMPLEEPGVFLAGTELKAGARTLFFAGEFQGERLKLLFTEAGEAQRTFWDKGSDLMWTDDREQAARILAHARRNDSLQDGSYEIPDFALYSVVSLEPHPFFILTAVKTDQVMKAKETLIRDSLFLALGLIGIILVVGVVSSNHLTRPLLKLREAVSQVARGEFGVQAEVKAKDEIGDLADGFNIMSAKLSSLVSSEIAKARMEKELETAQAVQNALFPASPMKSEKVTAFADYAPASECGGDLWQGFETEKAFHFVIGDVTGHGAAASLITSAIVGCIHLMKESDPTPDRALSLINEAIHSVALGRMQATLFWGRIDKETREMTFANAGHEAVILQKKDWPREAKKWKELLTLAGPVSKRIGESGGVSYRSETVALDAGDFLVFYTDGIFVRRKSDRDVSEADWMRALARIFAEAEGIEERSRALTAYCQGLERNPEQEDDLTWILIGVA